MGCIERRTARRWQRMARDGSRYPYPAASLEFASDPDASAPTEPQSICMYVHRSLIPHYATQTRAGSMGPATMWVGALDDMALAVSSYIRLV